MKKTLIIVLATGLVIGAVLILREYYFVGSKQPEPAISNSNISVEPAVSSETGNISEEKGTISGKAKISPDFSLDVGSVRVVLKDPGSNEELAIFPLNKDGSY